MSSRPELKVRLFVLNMETFCPPHAQFSDKTDKVIFQVDDEGGFIRQYRALPVKDDSTTIRIFERGDWYTAHGPDAEFIARVVYKTTAVIRNLGRSENALPSVTMTITAFRNFLRDALFKLRKRVEIWENTGKGVGGGWVLGKQASPGNLQSVEDELGAGMVGEMGHSAPIILAVKVSAKSDARTVGVCFADASVRELGVSEFIDNDLYSNLESLLIQLGVKECLLPADNQKKDVELNKIKTIANNCGIAVSERPMADFGIRDVEQDLMRLLKDDKASGTLPQIDLKLAMGSASALIKYVGIMTDPSNFGQYNLYEHDLAQFMKLDAAALRALNLMPGPRDGSKTMSLYGLLNHCKTPVGARLLAQWLKQPLMSLDEIEKRQQLVEAFVVDTQLRQTMQETHLRSIPDLYRLAKRFQRKQANLEDVVRAYQVVIRLPGFIGTLEGVMDEQYQGPLEVEYTSKLRGLSDSFARLAEMVETTVDLDALDHHEFIIKAGFDESLRTIRKKLGNVRKEMDQEHARASDHLGQEADKKLFLENHRTHGWCFRLTRTEASCIRNKKQYLEISTQKNGVYFTTQALQALRRDHDQLSNSYNRTQSSLVAEVVSVAASYTPVLESLASLLAHLDVIVSFAHVSVHAPSVYVRPKMQARGSGDTILKEARHPCMECQDDIAFITNDVELRRDSSRFLIITGPNMGGKSTYIRTIGTIALLAQVGCFVPCSEASVTIFDCILARVGASDSQLKGVSTFMAEMLETANILKSATQDSLIIIDELGRGTSTYDGFGLAWAISEEIVKGIGAFGCFATHFHELTALADQYPDVVKNLHVVAFVDQTTRHQGNKNDESCNDTKNSNREVTLLYRVEPGISDQSFGIHVAELVRFPEKVIKMARRKAEELEEFSSRGSNGSHRGIIMNQERIEKVETKGEEEKRQQNEIVRSGEKNQRIGGNESFTAAEIEEGSTLLKQMLVRWKQEVEKAGAIKSDVGAEDANGISNGGTTTMSKRQKADLMRELVRGDERLMANRFFNQAVRMM